MLDLDPRQRAMLEAMGVPVWWPEATTPRAATEVTSASEVATPAAASAAFPAVASASAAASATTPPVSAPDSPLAATDRSASAHPVANAVPAGGRSAAIAAMDWGQLQAAVAGCEACGLCHTRTRTVFGVGPGPSDTPPPVDFLVVGEAPGEQEDLAGEPFVGPAGKLLDNMLKAIGLSRHGAAPLRGAYIANALKCRPPGNRNPTPDELAQCLPHLQRQVALLRPKIILAAGRFAVQALLQDSVPGVHALPLGKLRGQVHHHQGVPVVVTYHPAYLLRALPEKAKAWADLCLALDTLNRA